MERKYNKDDTAVVTITDIGESGEGIGKVDGFTLFIKDAVVGDTVTAKIMKAKKNYAYARLISVDEPSPFRVQPACPAARQCGGCQIQAVSYEKQLEFKQTKVRNDLIRIGGFDRETVDAVMYPIVGMEDPWRYRNKTQLPVGELKDGPAAGFYAGRTHSIIPVKDCLLGRKENQEIVAAVLSYMRENHVPAYREDTGKGLIRHILIRDGRRSGEVMVCIIANKEQLPKEEKLLAKLSALPGIKSIVLNTNTARTNVIMGDRTRILYGADVIEDALCVSRVDHAGGEAVFSAESAEYRPEVRFRISARSFYQVNPRQTEKLYSIALHFAGLTGQEKVYDLYCGVGTISLFLAGHAGTVHGIEVIPEAIDDARRNAQLNGIENAVFTVGKVEEELPGIVAQEKRGADVIVVDPPRKGCDERCLETILKVQPRRVVYVSCDPATLARDLKVLAAGGYELKAVQPVDQFPHTIHVETVCLLSK